jgi:type II secretory pathway pseudopilin PulG
MKIHNLKFKTRSSQYCNPQFSIRNSHGFTYLALLATITIIGISLGAAGKYWQNNALREKEEELLFRGDQYRRAIERHYFAIPGRPEYPESIDKLLKDERTPTGRRHLRQKYKDPITGENFVEIRDQLSRRIIGVYSPSAKTPLKRANFPAPYREFAGKGKYSDWKFLSSIQSGQTPTPIRAVASPLP